jgi:hypothetical protein
VPADERGIVKRGRLYVGLLVAGVLVRVAASILTTNSPDLALFGYVVQQGGQGHTLYADPGFSYPPLVGYMFIAFGKLLDVLGLAAIVHAGPLQAYRLPGLAVADLTTPAASFLIKLPAMLSDAIAAWMLNAACVRCGVSDARRHLAVLAWWLNPMVIFDSAVQASWDSIVPAAIIASGVAAIDRKSMTAGAWLAVGALSKVVPILYVPLVAATLLCSERGIGRKFLTLFGAALGALLMTLVILAPVIYWGELTTLVQGTVLGRTGGAAFGGFNVWVALTMTSLSGVAAWVAVHGADIARFLLLAEVCVILAVAVDVARRSEITIQRWMLSAALTLAAVLLTAAYAQPGYAVWIIPFCLILWATGSRTWGILALSLTACSFFFTLAVRSPAALVIPACWFFKLCDAAAMQRATFAYGYAGGTFTPLLQLDRDVVLGVAGGIVILAIAWKSAVDLIRGRYA